jgi:cell division protein FtsL
MYRQSTRRNASRRSGSARGLSAQTWAVRGRRRLSPFFLRIGPVALCLCSVLLISLMAILYLSQLGRAVTINQQIQDLRTQQTELQRQNQDLVNTVGQEQSPAYIIAQAKKRGLIPANAQDVQVVTNP